MPKLIVFSGLAFTGTSKEYQSNDPDLTLTGDDFAFNSAIVASGQWMLLDTPGLTGTAITLGDSGGPDADGCFKDAADFGLLAAFHVRSLQR